MENNKILHFKFDVSTYRLLGRELITDRITALFELVKNCYDANSENVNLTFENVNKLSPLSKIIIQDDGLGMTFEDIRDKWMVIGTSSKRRSRTSPAPYNRIVAGKKGVGRFAVDKLGGKLVMKTKRKDSSVWHCLETDWSKYAEEEDRQLKINFDEVADNQKLFTDIDNKYWTEPAELGIQGTKLEISSLNDNWLETDVLRAYRELSKIVRPISNVKYPFNIQFHVPEYQALDNKTVESIVLTKATLSYALKYRFDKDTNTYYQEYLEENQGDLLVKEKKAEVFGPIGFSIYYYDQESKKGFSKDDRDGIKVYRDGIIATPFAEYKADRNEQKDLFGIDKRRWSGFFEKLSTRDIIGWVDITDELNPEIKDSTNRQDFVDNKEWSSLKEFVIKQIHQIELYLKHKKDNRKKENAERLKKADSDIDEIKQKINRIKSQSLFGSSEMETELNEITSRLGEIKQNVLESSKDYEQMEEDRRQQENIMFSLVSLQAYAGQISHILRISIGIIKRSAEFVTKWVPSGEKNEKSVTHSKRIFDEMNNLSKAMNFMLSYAEDDSTFEFFKINDAVSELFEDRYKYLFEDENIKTEYIVEDDFDLSYNKKAFQDMFGNLIDNSVKALRNIQDKRIRCTAYRENNKLIILFSDNGCGVPPENRDRIFDVFYTTTADLGGAGLGLYIVKTRLNSIKGTISLERSEFEPAGATFKIVIPLIH
ncbi:MAG: sensor histidine kinase [Bacteroidales bacterium]|nr:sensor histidine kinase [Bacteroidales bacterium]